MSTTTIHLPEDLQKRIALAAERHETSPHAFMLDALADRVDQDERRQGFVDTAEQRYRNIVTTGMTIPWSEMRSYLEDKVAGRATSRPLPRKLGAEKSGG
jgi:hypothetical protein